MERRLLGQRFELERLAAQGGMGTVHRALDRETGRVVALKLMRDAQSSAVDRFVQEAQLLAELRHEAIVPYVAHGRTPEGDPWLAMEWLEGEDLFARLRHGPLSVGQSLALVRRVADALSIAHARGIVHRDIKPSNLFLVDGSIERVMVLDFGVAQLGGRSRAMTDTGAVIGTPGYMAPEQARGDPAIDPSLDVFALGCVLFECLTGRAAFAAEHVMAVLAKILFEEAPRVRSLRDAIPAEVDDLCARMLAKPPRARPASGAALRAEIDDLAVMGEVVAQAVAFGPTALSAGELRVISVVVARGRGAETVAEAPTVQPTAESAKDRVRAAAEPFGARVEQLADGAFVAVVAGQGTASDQAAAAARCALAMRAALPQAPMVLATGRAVVSGRVPLGEVIDRAVRVLRSGAGTAHGVRLDDVTGGLLGARFELGEDDAGFVLRAERDALDSARLLLGRPTPFVGRDRELGALRGMLEEVVDESVARVALVVGAAGAGKSRLLQELLATVSRRPEPVALWLARGEPLSAGSPFGMLAQLIRRAVDGSDAAVPTRERLRRAVSERVEPTHAARVETFLAELLDEPDERADEQLLAARRDPVLMGDQIRRAVEDFVAGVCRAQPLLVVLEDLHWGDLPTVRSLEALLRWLKDAPLMIVGFARPEVHDTFPRAFGDRGVQELRLGELSRRACERFAQAMLGDRATTEHVARVVEQCDGNAFYLEELIRAVSEGRDQQLPATVIAMAQSRLEGLPADARQVLRAGSVFGGSFWLDGAQSLLARDGLRPILKELTDREVLVASSGGRFEGHEEWAFRHALLRDAAYAMLTHEDKKLGHALAGAWLEQVGERDAVVLAEHFERGGRNARAASFFRLAAEAAVEGTDFDAATARADRAVACGLDRVGLGELQSVLALAHVLQGRLSEARARGVEAMSLLDPGSDHWWLAARRLANAELRLGHGDALPALAQRLSAEIEANVRSVPVASLSVLAECLCFAGRYDVADALFAHVARLTPVELQATDEGHQLVARAARVAHEGDPSAAVVLRMAATRAFERAGRLRSSCHEAANVGAVLNELGAYAEAERMLQGALAGADRMDLRSARLLALENLGWSLAALGRLDEALAAETAAVEASRAQGDRRFESGSRTLLARIHLLRDELDAALAEAERGLELTDTSPPQRPNARAVLAAVLFARGQRARATAEATQALAELEALGGVEEGESLVRWVFAETRQTTDSVVSELARARERLLARAAHIRDETWRESFLRVPENAHTLARARELAESIAAGG